MMGADIPYVGKSVKPGAENLGVQAEQRGQRKDVLLFQSVFNKRGNAAEGHYLHGDPDGQLRELIASAFVMADKYLAGVFRFPA